MMSQDHGTAMDEHSNLFSRVSCEKTVRRFRWLWIGILFLIWPFGYIVESLNMTIFGWPIFALWMVIIVPVLGLGFYYVYGRMAIALEYSKEGVRD